MSGLVSAENNFALTLQQVYTQIAEHLHYALPQQHFETMAREARLTVKEVQLWGAFMFNESRLYTIYQGSDSEASLCYDAAARMPAQDFKLIYNLLWPEDREVLNFNSLELRLDQIQTVYDLKVLDGLPWSLPAIASAYQRNQRRYDDTRQDLMAAVRQSFELLIAESFGPLDASLPEVALCLDAFQVHEQDWLRLAPELLDLQRLETHLWLYEIPPEFHTLLNWPWFEAHLQV